MKLLVNYYKFIFKFLTYKNTINMDSFDYDSLERYIRKFKRNVINKLESTNLLEKDLKNQSDLLCLVLDYSPKIYDQQKCIKKIELKPSLSLLDGLNEKKEIRSFILEKHASHEGDSPYDSDKDHTIKLSKLSSKIQNEDCLERNNEIYENLNFNKNNVLFNIKDILKEIIYKAVFIAEQNINNNLELKISCNKIYYYINWKIFMKFIF